jgi:hypothetical protein
MNGLSDVRLTVGHGTGGRAAAQVYNARRAWSLGLFWHRWHTRKALLQLTEQLRISG